MLFHTLLRPAASGVYVGSSGFLLEGPLDAQALAQAWQGAVAPPRGAADGLRLGGAARGRCRWSGARAELPVRAGGLAGAGGARSRQARAGGATWRRTGGVDFDLARAPLLRLALFRAGRGGAPAGVDPPPPAAGRVEPVACCSATCWRVYAAHARGRSRELAQARGRTGTTSRGWQRQDLAGGGGVLAGRAGRLHGADPAARGPHGWRSGARGSGTARPLHAQLPAERTRRAAGAGAAAAGVTLNTLVQGAWALLLSRYAGEEDVVFGSDGVGTAGGAARGGGDGRAVHQHPAGAGTACGGRRRCGEWLTELQAEQVEAREHEYSPLAQVQRWSEVAAGEPLFESLVVFENYPVDQALGERGGRAGRAAGAGQSRAREQTNYPLVLTAQAGARAEPCSCATTAAGSRTGAARAAAGAPGGGAGGAWRPSPGRRLSRAVAAAARPSGHGCWRRGTATAAPGIRRPASTSSSRSRRSAPPTRWPSLRRSRR